ncbi:MAG: MipA/OmpV family protein [Gammaproteobacteria bacterium]|nr:MipA/OmpV family protein [Gammaproteobacteria bacterium]
MKTIYRPLLVVIAATILVPSVVQAGEWGIGVGVVRHGPAQQGADAAITGGPFPFYEGERLSLGFGAISYAFADVSGMRLALEGQPRFEGFDPTKSDALVGMHKRNPAFDIGFSLSSDGVWGQAQLRAVADITGTHDGYEVSASYQYPLQSGRWTLVPSTGLNWRSKKLVDYYYGVREDESRAGRPSYVGRSGLSATVGLAADYRLTEHWNVVAGADLTYLGDSIQDSPIIEKNHETSLFTALVYRF